MSEKSMEIISKYCKNCQKFYLQQCTYSRLFLLASEEDCGYRKEATEEWIEKMIAQKKEYIKYITTRSPF